MKLFGRNTAKNIEEDTTPLLRVKELIEKAKVQPPLPKVKYSEFIARESECETKDKNEEKPKRWQIDPKKALQKKLEEEDEKTKRKFIDFDIFDEEGWLDKERFDDDEEEDDEEDFEDEDDED